MPVDEVDVTAQGFVEQSQDAMPRVVAGHRLEGVGVVFNEVEDHGDVDAILRLRGGRSVIRSSDGLP